MFGYKNFKLVQTLENGTQVFMAWNNEYFTATLFVKNGELLGTWID